MTEKAERREGGAWIGQHPDENTDRVRKASLGEGAERVAITDNESGISAPTEGSPPRERERSRNGDDGHEADDNG